MAPNAPSDEPGPDVTRVMEPAQSAGTSVGHYRFGGSNIPVVCDGVPVNAGDIIAADNDGVVAIPRASAAEVLKIAREMDFKEHSMYATIERLKSIVEAVKQFGRI